MCHKVFSAAAESRKDLDAPTRLIPGCHPKGKIEVYIDSNKSIIVLCCSVCDKTIDVIKTKWSKYGELERKRRKKL